MLTAKLQTLFSQKRGRYGAPRLHALLRREGVRVSRKRVARILRECGLKACQKRRFKKTTDSAHDHPIAPNHLNQHFTAEGPNQVWGGDITYVWTCEGWLYLAVILDLYSRAVVGWAMDTHLREELCSRALSMALRRRAPSKGLVHHSDRGVQYTSEAYRNLLHQHGITPSMSRRGNCYDNAVVESFFGTLKQELVYREVWPTHADAKRAIFEYMECEYNQTRLHSTLGYLSPREFEALAQTQKVC